MLSDLLAAALAANPDRTALVAGEQTWTYRQLDRLSTKLAARWTADGLEHGDRVATLLANRPELVLVYLAGFKSGLTVVPLVHAYQPPQTAYALRHSGSRVLVTQADKLSCLGELAGLETLERVFVVDGPAAHPVRPFEELLARDADAEFPAVSPQEAALILYTSGTTSRPKGVTLSRRALLSGLRQWLAVFPAAADDVCLISSPLSRPMALRSQLLPTLATGGTVELLERFTPEDFLEAFRRPPAKTHLSLHPSALAQVLAYPDAAAADWSSVLVCVCGGDLVPPKLHEDFFARTGFRLTEQCGMTEAGVYASNPPLGRRKPGSIGPPYYGTRLRLVDAAGDDVRFGEAGEVLVHGDAVMDGYWNDTAQTRKAMRDGWVLTGDLARLDEDGYLWFVGRKKDILVRDSRKISPRQVEEVLLRHPGVALAGLTGVDDPVHGQSLVAVVVPRGGAVPPAQELIDLVARELEPAMVPERVVFAERLPLTTGGKLDRERLRWWVETGAFV